MFFAPVVSSRAMTGNTLGKETRQKILESLLRKEPQTVNGLATSIGEDQANVGRHVGRMERAGLVTVERRRGRLGSAVRLTEAGRTAARTI